MLSIWPAIEISWGRARLRISGGLTTAERLASPPRQSLIEKKNQH
jgi:hypothetical protein